MQVLPAVRPRRRPSWATLRLFLVFQLAAALPVVGVGCVLDARYEQQRTTETLRDARTQAAFLADLVIAPRLGDADLTAADPAAEQAALAALLADPAVREQVYRVKVWDAAGRVVASDDPSIVGRTFPDDDERDEALHGEVSAEVTSTATAAEHASERALGRAVEVYAPLHPVGDPTRTTGVVEVYLPYAGLASDLQRASAQLRHDLATALVALVLALAAVTWPVLARLQRQAEDAERAATTDALTGLRNRAGLEAWLAEDAAAGREGVLVLADVAGLRDVNEALGHDGGDALLRHVGAALSTAARRARVARTGGGEFALLLPGADDLPGLLGVLRDRVAEPVEVAGVPITPLLSLGAARRPEHAATTAALVQRAGAALQAARRLPSGWAVYDRACDPFDAGRLRLLTELRAAVPAGQLRLHYQPQVDPRTGEAASCEALVRWAHPERGLLGPADFVPMAERTGLITAVTAWVLAEAARQQAAWARAGAPRVVSVNISARDLADPGFAARAAALVAGAGARPQDLQLELTETALVTDPEGARAVLVELAAAGFRLSLDDFGQGATSLSQLRDLPVHELKLDRAFVAGMAPGSADAAIVASVVELAHNLGLVVVAEGVETPEQAAGLAEAGYDLLQGWHLGRPAPAGELPAAAQAFSSGRESGAARRAASAEASSGSSWLARSASTRST